MILGEAHIPEGQRVYAIGDIHGCLEHLEDLLALIERDSQESPIGEATTILLGDYVDRGPFNKEVVDFILQKANDRDFLCLLGNHDLRLLNFIKDPESVGNNFLEWGGMQTMGSYGLTGVDGLHYIEISKRLARLVPEEHIAFIEKLYTEIEIGDYFFCHAGVRPGVPLAAQSVDDLVWIRGEFIAHSDPYEKIIIHGHTIQDGVPDVQSNRINVDTGCYATGILTALVLEGNNHRFLKVRGEPVYP